MFFFYNINIDDEVMMLPISTHVTLLTPVCVMCFLWPFSHQGYNKIVCLANLTQNFPVWMKNKYMKETPWSFHTD